MNALNNLALTLASYVPPTGGEAPPGTEMLNTIVSWVMWAASAFLFVLFIVGLVKAANARNQGGSSDAAAPIWPLVCAVLLGSAGFIWAGITG